MKLNDLRLTTFSFIYATIVQYRPSEGLLFCKPVTVTQFDVAFCIDSMIQYNVDSKCYPKTYCLCVLQCIVKPNTVPTSHQHNIRNNAQIRCNPLSQGGRNLVATAMEPKQTHHTLLQLSANSGGKASGCNVDTSVVSRSNNVKCAS
jgi:hypothetical protein